MHAATRVENEVAMISLAAAALAGFKPHIVPSIYAWASAATPSSHGWILQELMPGVPVDGLFPSMVAEQKKNLFSQMASILRALQEYQLPDTIAGFGGVTFNDTGRIVSAAMPTVRAGPWQSFEDSYRARLEVALEKADKNQYIQG